MADDRRRNLFDPDAVAEVQRRLQTLRPDSPRQWGTMTPSQMVVHCARAVEQALGERRPPRAMIGRVLGWAIKPLALGNDAPMRRNSPTMPELVVNEEPDLAAERARLSALIDRFVAAGPAGCTTHPHGFFGRLTPREWAVLMYKHLDHHLRQFGV
ncbi:protein of unknown function DUF1569 (plasmid) [Gemmatirosa kalamazoonensis]|uniref:DUF1569 domain-containing protein n=1 Tax=Gemmatirosa kalamazoonensis TaxID=861299 RepID=W0RS66_9BACT|nr:DUF1569 domain-containing protein [Gemmatirosa kalamazoonensis]AHG93546.1 protein of unknown function DUF1569 [Gemmatirosa kalamazoonensis]